MIDGSPITILYPVTSGRLSYSLTVSVGFKSKIRSHVLFMTCLDVFALYFGQTLYREP